MMRGRADTVTKTGILALAVACGLGVALAAGDLRAADPITDTPLDTQSAAYHAPEAAARMVQELGDQTAHALASPQAQEPKQRREMLRGLVREGFDLDLTSQFVLGKYWNSASEQQRTEFMDLFTEYLLNSYARHLISFQADTLSIVGSHPIGDEDVLVETSVEGLAGTAAPVWRLRAVNGRFKIIDVTVDGVSLALTQRREFASVVNRVGLEGLLKMLREKLEAQAKTTQLKGDRPSHSSLLGGLLSSPNANRIGLSVAGQ